MSSSTDQRNSHLPLYLLLCLLSAAAADELQILLTLKSAFQGSNTNNIFNSWNSTNPVCSFDGIACNENGFVRDIDLSNQNLSGFLAADAICQLESLETLAFGFNFLDGTIKEDLNNCVNLKYLDLGHNSFSGSFPDISSLSRLEHLHLNNSGFSGTFPWKSLANMTGLIRLSLGDNPFDQSQFPTELLNLKKLNWLYLANCSLGGPIPKGIGNLTELINLELSQNNMDGEIPSDITKLNKLWQLELYGNKLTGRLPSGLRNLTNLENFDASQNRLEGDLSELRFLENSVTLQFYENNFTGEIPAEFGEFKKLVNLSLYTNKLTGPLPQKLGSWSKIDFIDVSDNLLTGSIPSDMCKMGTMRGLFLLQNNFTGEIPANYAKCLTLKRFRVNINSLSGVVPPGIWGLPNAEIIDLTSNQFQGPITSDIGNAKTLAQLFVSYNQLSGELPDEISKATSLLSIVLNNNRFSGKIPGTIGDLKSLGTLYLQSNMFSASIPKSLGSCDFLSYLNIAENSLSGDIPSSLGSLPTLNSLNLSRNQLSGEIPKSLGSLRLSLLDLSHNRLTGAIPKSLSIAAYNGSFSGNSGLCSTDITSFPRCSSRSGMSKDVRTLIICFSVGLAILLASLTCFLFLKKGEKYEDRSLKEESWDVKSFHVMSFTEGEILDSIKQENLIGKGGSGNVYRVLLANGKELAVKHIWNTNPSGRKRFNSTSPMLAKRGGKSKEFDAEVQTLSSIRHVNVVKLYCSITSEDSSLLVYEYMPNGSLWDRLHTCQKMKLDWETRHEIAVGAAKGLEYLHHGLERLVIHRDVKSSNILLDEFLKPRIADFGLAKIVQATAGKDSTHVIAGTHGYIAPEYGYTYKVNEKSDVYSFGVVLMELVTGKRPIEPEFGENKDIVSWVSSMLKSRESILSMVDSFIPEVYKEEAIKVLRIAVLCTARLPELRPSMRSVVQMLEEAHETFKLLKIVIGKDDAAGNKKMELAKGIDN
ncbi:receptor-like protein kinase 7 [Pyrus x bretschneideri]|uniref:receptor-like protein kinase 7 n=1 Tax=Pyrus x bretschneideri TaxID=225117 RepID=UPI00202E6880|nr:receptor-like protein kinase 7 [Pyrus x bretschneideri]